jgi:hypothetical protein
VEGGAAARCCAVMDGKPVLGRPLIARTDRFEEDDCFYGAAAVGGGAAGQGASGEEAEGG